MTLFRFIFCVAMVTMAHGYPMFRDRIPNGMNVPNPCGGAGSIWQGVGHLNMQGGGDRNPFGKAFEQQGYVWTQELCMQDSDGDGITNGEELGDPDCEWTEGSNSTFSDGLSHPGVCEPFDSEMCRNKNKDIVCEDSEFVCDGIHDPDISKVDVRLTDTEVPAKETTYMCQAFDLPDTTRDYHVIAAEPVIDNINVLHHIVIYGCDESVNVTDMMEPKECFMEPQCEEMLFIWAFGATGTCIHKDTGFLVGANGYKKLLMEMHWNNPTENSNYRDSSGMKLYLTPNLRSQNAGVMMIGQNLLIIPPRKEFVSVNGTCTSDCSSEGLTGPISIFGVLNHMHFLGISAFSALKSMETGDVTHLGVDEVYDYNSPKYHSFDEPPVAYPGDEFTLICNFKSTSRSRTTHFGFGSSDEMCFAFIMYYPKENGISQCTSSGSIGDCEWGRPVVGGCDMSSLDPTNPAALQMYSDVGTNCLTSVCLEECKDVVRELNKSPCYQFPLKYIIQEGAMASTKSDVTQRAQVLEHYYKMDSCDAELARETWFKDGGKWPDHTSGASAVYTGFVVSMAYVLMVKLF